MVQTRNLSSTFGFTCMLGGALFGVLLIVGTLLSDSLTTAGTPVLGWMLTLALGFLVPGGVVLYLVQRSAFGRFAHLAGAAFLVGLFGYLAVVLLDLGGVDVPSQVGFAALAVPGVGQFAFGVATARHGVLAHASSGGILLALAISLSIGAPLALEAAGVGAPLVTTLTVAVPISAAWMLLGLDLLTAAEGGVDADAVVAGGAD